ncbi:MAG: hypothetical protein DRI57_16355 [Deltaproteobacteria bacterium]|nr:MAG: hypothetical protein DRI57_16355 [Deltaproteobacteria bacterium]
MTRKKLEQVMTREKLKTALSSVDWNANISEFVKETSLTGTIANCNLRLAIWSRQFEETDKGNPALPFIREMQIAGHHTAALTGLALYKPAAAAMRTLLETTLFYTYFRCHPCELATLVRNEDYFVQKSDLLDYHKKHTPEFDDFGLVGKINKWYRQVSSIVHGQIPGIWTGHESLAQTKHVSELLPVVVDAFQEGEEIVHQLFLCTVGRDLWPGFSTDSKRKLLKGLPGEIKKALGLDAA